MIEQCSSKVMLSLVAEREEFSINYSKALHNIHPPKSGADVI
jgi:hypothetical protein